METGKKLTRQSELIPTTCCTSHLLWQIAHFLDLHEHLGFHLYRSLFPTSSASTYTDGTAVTMAAEYFPRSLPLEAHMQAPNRLEVRHGILGKMGVEVCCELRTFSVFFYSTDYFNHG